MVAHQTGLRYGEITEFGSRGSARRSNRSLWVIAGVLAAVAITALAWLFVLMREPTVAPAERTDSAPRQTPPSFAPERPVVASPDRIVPPTQPAALLPALGDSDPFARSVIEGVVGRAAIALFYPDEIVRRLVATVDNLPRSGSLWSLFPVRPASSSFAVATTEHGMEIAAANAARYRPYVAVVEAVSSKLVVRAYLHLYPLLQQQYEALGFPGRQFNARVIAALDDLLDAPEMSGPLALVPGRVMYEFADADLQGLSAGQKLMLRIGPENAKAVKAKLREIRRAIEASTVRDHATGAR